MNMIELLIFFILAWFILVINSYHFLKSTILHLFYKIDFDMAYGKNYLMTFIAPLFSYFLIHFVKFDLISFLGINFGCILIMLASTNFKYKFDDVRELFMPKNEKGFDETGFGNSFD